MPIRTSLASALPLAALLLAGPAAAQDQMQMLGEDQVRDFLSGLSEDVRQAVETRDAQQIRQWTQETIADGAVFMVSSEVYRDDERTAFSVANLDKEDLLALQGFGLSSMMDQGGPQLQDVSWEIEVEEVRPIGPNAATVATRITESATIAAPDGQAMAQAGETQAGQAQDVQATGAIRGARFESTSDCHHLIQRAPDGERLQIGMTTCQSRIDMMLRQ
ncbi:hypothetical protein [Salinarimonas sp.]|uniref:hypothetical protein n=1 Tax=Salinarimonas sp. TaxID=2766526 RepID=UPI0032D94522